MTLIKRICLVGRVQQRQMLMRSLLASSFTLLVLFCSAQITFAQRQNYTLYGDIQVDESRLSERAPSTFDVLLFKNGNLIGRQKIGTNGRYRFMNLTTGSYEVAIEIEGVETVRIQKIIAGSNYSDDQRLDISLVWKPVVESKPQPIGSVSIADTYLRGDQNRILFKRAVKEAEQKQYRVAAGHLNELLAADPIDHPAWFELGTIHFVLKDFERAENCFATAAKLQPAFLPALLNLGRVRLAQKNYDGAVEALSQTLKVDSRNAAANYFLAESFLQLRRGALAAQYFNIALKVDPIGMADAHLRLGQLYSSAGYKAHAALEYEQFLIKRPNYSERTKLEQYIAINRLKPTASPK